MNDVDEMDGLDEEDLAWDDAGPEDDSADDSGDEPASARRKLYYPTVEVFVTSWLAPTYRRHLSQRSRVWCPRWWRHAEAISRLDAMWRSWEHLRLEPTMGMSVWYREHGDVHMAVLLDPEGPFRNCRMDSGHSPTLEPLPLEEPPRGTFLPPIDAA